MPFLIVKGDITEIKVDAIVNAANNTLLGGGGVDGCIHRAAGPNLVRECATLHGCETGDAKITGAYNLPCRHVIHTVGPVWRDGNHHEEELLVSCYRKSLQLAWEHGCQTLAFPLISSGVYGYPKYEALQVASRCVAEFLQNHDMTIYLVIYGRGDYSLDGEFWNELDDYVSEKAERDDAKEAAALWEAAAELDYEDFVCEAPAMAEPMLCSREVEVCCRERAVVREVVRESSLEDALRTLDESFTQMLLRKIDEKGISDVDCYKRANLDRKLFSRIRSDYDYRPSKPTVVALALALELSLEEAQEMLGKAGFALSHSNKFDIIVEYFIKKCVFDVYEVNKALFQYDQKLLGSK